MHLINILQTCTQTVTLINAGATSLTINIMRPLPCSLIISPMYAQIEYSGNTSYQFLLNYSTNAALQSASGLTVVAQCLPAQSTQCQAVQTILNAGQNVVLTAVVNTDSSTLSPSPSLAIDTITAVSLTQQQSVLTFTINGTIAGNALIGASCLYAANLSTATTGTMTTTNFAANVVQLSTGSSEVAFNCAVCATTQVYTCNLAIGANNYYNIQAVILKPPPPADNSAYYVYGLGGLCAVLAFIVAILLCVKKAKKNAYKQPVQADRKAVSKAQAEGAKRMTIE